MSCPLGIEQLMTCNEVTMKVQLQFFKIAYDVTAPHLGHILRIAGNYNFKIKDTQDNIIARFTYSQVFCEGATTVVQVADTPPIVLKPKSMFGTSIYFWENDKPLLKLKLASRWTRRYLVLAGDNTEVGSIKTLTWGDYTVRFPLDMDVRYKTALLAACLHLRRSKR